MAAHEKLRTILAELRRRFEELYSDRLVKMILYGSQARGDARRWSDIDVLVVLKGPVRPSEEIGRTGGVVSEVCLDFDVVIQCLFVDEDRYYHPDEPVLYEAHREGIEV